MISTSDIHSLYLQGLTTREVAARLGCGKSYVQKVVSRAGLSRKREPRLGVSVSKLKHFQVSEIRSYLDGLLISDGAIAPFRGRGISSCYIQTCSKKEWLKVIKRDFERCGIEAVIGKDFRLGRKKHWVLRTRSYAEFAEFRCRWYPNNVKRVPSDVDFANVSFMKNWIYGDGTLCGRTALRLCCEGFHQTEWLQNRLSDSWPYEFKKLYVGDDVQGKPKLRVTLSKGAGLFVFLKQLGKPLKCFSYKWGE